MLEAAFAQADLVVLAPGSDVPSRLPDEWAQLLFLLDLERDRGIVVARSGDSWLHPMRWATRSADDTGYPRILSTLTAWPPATQRA